MQDRKKNQGIDIYLHGMGRTVRIWVMTCGCSWLKTGSTKIKIVTDKALETSASKVTLEKKIIRSKKDQNRKIKIVTDKAIETVASKVTLERKKRQANYDVISLNFFNTNNFWINFLPSDKNHNWLLRGETWLTNKLSRIFFLRIFFSYFFYSFFIKTYYVWSLGFDQSWLLYAAVLGCFNNSLFCSYFLLS